MPVYQCYSPKGLLTESAKAKIADEMTSLYCNATGAPPSWVKVLFHEMPSGDCFTAGKPATQSLILGINRYGRDLETRRSMLRELSQIWTRNVLEAGLFIPAPGQEHEWLEENREKLAELGIAAA